MDPRRFPLPPTHLPHVLEMCRVFVCPPNRHQAPFCCHSHLQSQRNNLRDMGSTSLRLPTLTSKPTQTPIHFLFPIPHAHFRPCFAYQNCQNTQRPGHFDRRQPTFSLPSLQNRGGLVIPRIRPINSLSQPVFVLIIHPTMYISERHSSSSEISHLRKSILTIISPTPRSLFCRAIHPANSLRNRASGTPSVSRPRNSQARRSSSDVRTLIPFSLGAVVMRR